MSEMRNFILKKINVIIFSFPTPELLNKNDKPLKIKESQGCSTMLFSETLPSFTQN